MDQIAENATYSCSWTKHDALRNSEDFRLHVWNMFTQFNEQHSEVSAAQIQRQKLALLYGENKKKIN